MDEAALERVRRRMSAPAANGGAASELETAIERSKHQIEALAAATAGLEAAIPDVGDAVRAGLRTEVLPVARHIAELRGLFNQANTRLERIEANLLAERQARVDDLALLVELVSSGWRGVDARLTRLESTHDEAPSNGHVEQLPSPARHGDGLAERAAAA